MIGKSLVFVCAAFALVSGYYIDSPLSQGVYGQFASAVVAAPVSSSYVSAPVSTSVVAAPVSASYVSAPVSSVVEAPVVSAVSAPVVSAVSAPVVSAVSAPVVSAVSAPVVSAVSAPVVSAVSAPVVSAVSAPVVSAVSSFPQPITDGPQGSPVSVIQAPSVTLPAVEGPVVSLASQPIPAPRVISERCVCTKTVVKPQVIQRQVTVPRIQRYLKRTVTPVIENVAYKSSPVNQGFSQVVASSPVASYAPAVCNGRCSCVC